MKHKKIIIIAKLVFLLYFSSWFYFDGQNVLGSFYAYEIVSLLVWDTDEKSVSDVGVLVSQVHQLIVLHARCQMTVRSQALAFGISIRPIEIFKWVDYVILRAWMTSGRSFDYYKWELSIIFSLFYLQS